MGAAGAQRPPSLFNPVAEDNSALIVSLPNHAQPPPAPTRKVARMVSSVSLAQPTSPPYRPQT